MTDISDYRMVDGQYVMPFVEGRSFDKALQAVAHNICATAHPLVQINMTGWVSIDGQFLVSCAHCKMKVYDFYKKVIEDAKIDNS